MPKLANACVFCGSSDGTDPRHHAAADSVGRLLASRGIGVVYGGGRVGLMGRVANAALSAGGRVTGVIPRFMTDKEVAHSGLTQLFVVETMHQRKALMERLSDGFITLPGGIGTFEEICEMLAWAQLGLHPKPCGLLNVNGYYDPLIALFDRAEHGGFMKPPHRALLLVGDDPASLLERMEQYEYPQMEKILERGRE